MEHPRGYKETDPTQEEFFSNADVVKEVSSLVRESIQNSLDERLDLKKPVEMVFTLGAQSAKKNHQYFDALLPHVEQIPELEVPSLDDPASFLVIEDFNTRGLEGSVNSEAPTNETLEKVERESSLSAKSFKESYFFFQWKSGKSNKGDGNKGSWGVGKVVFPRASAIKAYLVYSVRRSNPQADSAENILFGSAIYNYRHVKGVRYDPDCHWMVKSKSFKCPVPSTDKQSRSEFIKDWNLARTKEETGTSIVIPYCEPSITISKLVQSIIRDYFVNILSGVLVCTVRDSDSVIVINSKTIISEIADLDSDMTTRASKTEQEIRDLCHMYLDKLQEKSVAFEITHEQDFENQWNLVEFDDATRAEMEAAWEDYRTLEIIVPVSVPDMLNSKRQVVAETIDEFVVLLKRSAGESSTTLFCREGILIPNANNYSKLQETISLVLVGDVSGAKSSINTIANLLKWSEGPSHESWSSQGTKFKGKYKPIRNGERAIVWVKNSASSLMELIRAVNEEVDLRSLSDYAPDDEGTKTPIGVSEDEPYVRLFLKQRNGDGRLVTLAWKCRNLSQNSFSLYRISPTEHLVVKGLKETFSEVVLSDSQVSEKYYIEISDGTRVIRSNILTLDPVSSTSEIFLIRDRFANSRVAGFEISPVDQNLVPIGAVLEVRAGYESRQGNAISKWSAEDFILKNMMVNSFLHGLQILESGDERMLFEIQSSNFSVAWEGFDSLRNVEVNASIVGRVE